MSASKATEAMKQIGRAFWGARYVAPMAAAMRTDGYSLNRWGRGKGPANLPDRLSNLLDSLLAKHIGLALSAAEWRVRMRAQSDIVDVAMVARLRDIQRELAPAPKAVAPAPPAEPPVVYIEEVDYVYDPLLTLDQLCEGMPDWQEQQIRELYARPD